MIDAYRAACDDADREPGEIVLQAMVAWGRDDEEALEGARPWKGAQPPEYYVDDWHDPAAMLAHGEQTVSDDEFRRKAILSADPDEHVERLREVIELGATTLSVMNVSGHDPEGAIRVYGEQVLPRLRDIFAAARSASDHVETRREPCRRARRGAVVTCRSVAGERRQRARSRSTRARPCSTCCASTSG